MIQTPRSKHNPTIVLIRERNTSKHTFSACKHKIIESFTPQIMQRARKKLKKRARKKLKINTSLLSSTIYNMRDTLNQAQIGERELCDR